MDIKKQENSAANFLKQNSTASEWNQLQCLEPKANENQQKIVHFPLEANSWKPAESEQTCKNQQITTLHLLETKKHSFRKESS